MPDPAGAPDPPAWRVLLEYVRPYRRWLLLGGALSLVTGATGLVLPLAARALVDNLGHHRPVTVEALLMSLLVIGNAAVGALGSFVLHRTRSPWCSPPPRSDLASSAAAHLSGRSHRAR